VTETPPQAPYTVVLVDDQSEFLELARGLLARGAALQVVGDASSGEAALALIAQLAPQPDIALVDVEMPGLDGFETARRLRALAPTVRVILTSASSNTRYAAAAVGVGAVFLPKRRLSAKAVLDLVV
jgi:two-component system, NarL family, response regulator DesR